MTMRAELWMAAAIGGLAGALAGAPAARAAAPIDFLTAQIGFSFGTYATYDYTTGLNLTPPNTKIYALHTERSNPSNGAAGITNATVAASWSNLTNTAIWSASAMADPRGSIILNASNSKGSGGAPANALGVIRDQLTVTNMTGAPVLLGFALTTSGTVNGSGGAALCLRTDTGCLNAPNIPGSGQQLNYQLSGTGSTQDQPSLSSDPTTGWQCNFITPGTAMAGTMLGGTFAVPAGTSTLSFSATLNVTCGAGATTCKQIHASLYKTALPAGVSINWGLQAFLHNAPVVSTLGSCPL
jgi:hypothetical protein